MIYDRAINVYNVGTGSSPLTRKLTAYGTYLCRVLTVYRRTAFEARQAGESIDRMVQMPWAEGLNATQYAVMEDGHVYRIIEARPDRDGDELPVIVLSLHREEGRFDFIGAD